MGQVLSRILAGVLLLTPLTLGAVLPAAAAELDGEYVIEGRDPGGGAKYKGQVLVVKEDATYSVIWKIQNQVLYGTGILQDKSFAVTYLNYGPASAPGLALYDVSDDGTLTGRFTMLGAKNLGVEAWIRTGGLGDQEP
ncbi:MAG TPA: hypothetical protein VFS04_06060 [Alphaproteobacteria bacterium]|nr:hypothetical protein [Alphaproteobacteria bacterium]